MLISILSDFSERSFLVQAVIFLILINTSLLFIFFHLRKIENKKYLNLLERYLAEMEKINNTLRESEHKCQVLMDHLNEGILVINEKGIVLFANKQISMITGTPLEKIVHHPIPDWISHGEKLPLVNKDSLRKGRKYIEEVQLMKGNKSHWLKLKWEFQPTPEGEPGAAVTISDISHKVALEEKIQQLTADTNELNRQINCLFDISDISGVPNITFDEIFERSLEIIPKGLKFSHDCWVEIVFEQKRFVSKNFRETPWNFTAPIKIKKKKLGYVKVGYHEEKPKNSRDSFHMNEKLLIKNIAEKLAQVIELMNLESQLDKNTLQNSKNSPTKKK